MLNKIPYIITCNECNNMYIPDDYSAFLKETCVELPCKHTLYTLYKHSIDVLKVEEGILDIIEQVDLDIENNLLLLEDLYLSFKEQNTEVMKVLDTVSKLKKTL